MAPVLTAEDVVRRIAAECAYVDERGGVGIRLEAAAAIVRQYGEQFRRLARKPPRRSPKPARSLGEKAAAGCEPVSRCTLPRYVGG
jgi:hypothetical protein